MEDPTPAAQSVPQPPQNEVIIELNNDRTHLTFIRNGTALYGLNCSTDDVQKMVEQHVRAYVGRDGD